MNASPQVIPHALAPAEAPAQGRPAAGVRPLDPLRETAWDSLVAAHPDATFFHTAAWARVLNETYGHAPACFGHRRSAQFSALLPLMEVNSRLTGRRGVSLPFTDECAPLGAEPAEISSLLEQARPYGRSRGWKYLELRGLHGLPLEVTPSVSFFGHQLALDRGENELFAGLESAVRRGIRKARAAGLVIERHTDLAAMRCFYQLHVRTRRRHGVPPQPFRFFENIARHAMQTGHGFVFTASHQGRVIAAAVFLHHRRHALYKFGASDYDAQDLRPNNLLMWEAILHYREQGFASLDFGRTSLANAGLRRFKLGFGPSERTIQYARFDFRSNRYVTTADRAEGSLNRLFRCLPLPVLRLLGSALYPHLS